MFERPKIIKSNAIFAPVSQKVYAIMNRDAIDFERDGVFSLFRKLLIPTLLGSVAMSAMSTIDGIFVGHGVGAAGVAAVNIAVPVYQVMTGIGFMIGAGSVINGAKGNSICDFLGQISYPLYITHYPLMYVQMSWVYSHVDAPLFSHVTVNVGVFILSIFIAWAALKLYDLPVREWLKKF